jgi:hypothetical protein
MAVPKHQRTLSDMEFFHNLLVLEKRITALLLRDFGTKKKIRSTKMYAMLSRMTDEDREEFQSLCDKYEITRLEDEYPEWMITHFRKMVLEELQRIRRSIVLANSVYPTTVYECEVRRRCQNYAIGYCENLMQTIQYISNVIDVDLNKYLPYVDMIDHEIALLKDWRKSDNKIRRRIKRQEEAEYFEQHPELAGAYAIYDRLRNYKINREHGITSEMILEDVNNLIEDNITTDDIIAVEIDGPLGSKIYPKSVASTYLKNKRRNSGNQNNKDTGRDKGSIRNITSSDQMPVKKRRVYYRKSLFEKHPPSPQPSDDDETRIDTINLSTTPQEETKEKPEELPNELETPTS